MLEWHNSDNTKVKAIAKALNSSYYHHGYAVGRHEASKIGLPIIIPGNDIECLIWDIWEDFCNEMKCNETFDVVKEIMSNPTSSAAISQVPIVNLPANTPPEIAQQIIIQHAQSVPITTRSSLKQKELVASIESINSAKAVYTNIDIVYWRNPDMSLGFNCTGFTSGWVDYEI